MVDIPLRLIGDEHNPANVVVEMSGTIVWRAKGGFIEGVTFRRPKIASGESLTAELLRIANKGRVDMVQCVFDNEGSSGDVVSISGDGRKGIWESCLFQRGLNGIALYEGAQLDISQVRTNSRRRVPASPAWTPILAYQCACVCLVGHRQSIVEKNRKSGLVGKDKAELKIDACAIQKNGSHGVSLHDSSRATLCRSRLLSNKGLVVKKESSGCHVTCSANVCTKSAAMSVAPPGFQFVSKS